MFLVNIKFLYESFTHLDKKQFKFFGLIFHFYYYFCFSCTLNLKKDKEYETEGSGTLYLTFAEENVQLKLEMEPCEETEKYILNRMIKRNVKCVRHEFVHFYFLTSSDDDNPNSLNFSLTVKDYKDGTELYKLLNPFLSRGIRHLQNPSHINTCSLYFVNTPFGEKNLL